MRSALLAKPVSLIFSASEPRGQEMTLQTIFEAKAIHSDKAPMSRSLEQTLSRLAGLSLGFGFLALAACSATSEASEFEEGGSGAAGISAGGRTGGSDLGGSFAPTAGAPPVRAGTPGFGGRVGRSGGGVAPSGGSGGNPNGGVNRGGSASGGSGNTSGGNTAATGGNATDGSGGNASAGGGNQSGLLQKFSFFVTSMKAMQELSGSQDGFGGDLRFGKADGLAGADEICRRVAEMGLPGAGNKQWRAFLSVAGPPAVHARERIGQGPWYDVQGRLVAEDLQALLSEDRPQGDPAVVDDLPNERGEPNHYVGANGYTPGRQWDNHDTLTGSDEDGRLYGEGSSTCADWTSKSEDAGEPRIGHSWPRSNSTGRGAGFASDHDARGCTPGYNLDLNNGAGRGTCVGCGGGYGGLYCFVLSP